MPLVEVTTAAEGKHVGLIERKIRRVKGKTQATTSKFSFVWIPIMVLIHTVYECVFWLNAFPVCLEIFGFSICKIFMWLSTDYEQDRKIDLGSYVEASIRATFINNNTKQLQNCATIGPDGN